MAVSAQDVTYPVSLPCIYFW